MVRLHLFLLYTGNDHLTLVAAAGWVGGGGALGYKDLSHKFLKPLLDGNFYADF